nr:MAG TPA: hypothetical protein [Caudoviricetes sp.]DAZ67713.1 MAG TPA: hypothetical protein [Caudoviricetes sp.]
MRTTFLRSGRCASFGEVEPVSSLDSSSSDLETPK